MRNRNAKLIRKIKRLKMSNESVAKLRATMIRKYGSEEAWKAHMHENAIKGGKKSRRKLTKEQAREMGKVGGKATRKVID